MTAAAVDTGVLERIEELATTLAREAGAVASGALQRAIVVDYKPDNRGRDNVYNPVSEVDRAVEDFVRTRIAEAFPDHAIIGEEVDVHPDEDAEWVWVVDPVDGTTNFVNGFPLFAVSVGVLYRGRPVVGAVWCATTHLLRPGVYHAHEGGPLCIDGVAMASERATKVRRALAAAPGGASAGNQRWDHRVTGSTSVEITYVAAGIFVAAPFRAPFVWDVAGGIVLVRAAGREVWIRDQRGQWSPFERFEAPARLPGDVKEQRAPSVRDWRATIIAGTAEATSFQRERWRDPPLSFRIRRRLRQWRRRLARR